MLRKLALASSLLALVSCAAEDPGEAVGTERDPVLYGQDDRVDYFDVTDPAYQALEQQAVVGVIVPENLDQRNPSAVRFTASSLDQYMTFCSPAPWYASQMTAAICSGTLIDDDLVLTAGHCYLDEEDCQRHRLVFKYYYAAPGQLETPTADDVYACRRLVARRWDAAGVDYSVVQLDRPVTAGHQAPRVDATRGTLTVGAPIVGIGCGDGLPFKLDTGGRIVDPRTSSNDYFTATPDAFGGNSGMGIYNAALDLVGVLVRGSEDYREVGNCLRVNVLDDNCTGAACPFDGENIVHVAQAIDGLCATGWPSQRLCGRAAVCGDGTCSGTETSESCANDCPASRCGDGVCDATEAAGGCSVDCSGPSGRPTPPEWTCAAQYVYAGHDGCDCACGAYDPDCNDPTQEVFHCPPGGTCSPEGTCEGVQVPAGWTCADASWGSRDGCDCGCGIIDPDCQVAGQEVMNCAPGETCEGTVCSGTPGTRPVRGTSSSGGCGCRAAGSRPPSGATAALVLGLLLSGLRRRRR